MNYNIFHKSSNYFLVYLGAGPYDGKKEDFEKLMEREEIDYDTIEPFGSMMTPSYIICIPDRKKAAYFRLKYDIPKIRKQYNYT